jgi:hypothetical protein
VALYECPAGRRTHRDDAAEGDAAEGDEEKCDTRFAFEISKYNNYNIHVTTDKTLENHCNYMQHPDKTHATYV